MTLPTKAIEAGARAVWDCELSDGDTVGTLIYNSDYVVPASRDDMHAQAHIICETISDAVIKAALASGALVPASAVAEMRERCAALIRSWTNHSKMQLHAGEMTAQEKRTTEAILNAIERQVSALPAPASGKFVVVPRKLTDEMYFAGCDAMEEWTDPNDGEAIKAAWTAMLHAATKDGERK